jgi:hypothetical protein
MVFAQVIVYGSMIASCSGNPPGIRDFFRRPTGTQRTLRLTDGGTESPLDGRAAHGILAFIFTNLRRREGGRGALFGKQVATETRALAQIAQAPQLQDAK